MLRYYKGLVAAFGFFILCFGIGILTLKAESGGVLRAPAGAHDFTAAEMARATLAASPAEAQDSKPQSGRSYFDKVFSENGQYKVPYPFQQVLNRLSDYTGNPDSVKVAMFPMGRSLQRSAAVDDLRVVSSLDPYFIFPRVVVGVDEETTHENSLLLNLKNKLYLGFNQKAEVIEAISYNEELGRYEYQVIKNYAAGKTPQVTYANRGLCLSCHQNLSPLFSRGPWSESNANPVVAEHLKTALDKAYGKVNCSSQKNQAYCYQNQNSFYFGSPVQIESNVTRQLDASTDLANLNHVYQKMWKELCASFECKSVMLRAMVLYRMTGQVGLALSKSLKEQLDKMENEWRTNYPWGLSIPDPDIPDRDPLKDVDSAPNFSDLSAVTPDQRPAIQALLMNSKIPAAFEPLQLRAPIDLWKNTGFDASTNTNRMIRGLAQDFTTTDLKIFDQWLKSNHKDQDILTTLTATCDLQKDKNNQVISCKGQTEESFSFDAYVTTTENSVSFSALQFQSQILNCEITQNCPQFSEVTGIYKKSNESQAVLTLRQKNGLSLRTSSGYDISEIKFDLVAKVAHIQVLNQDKYIAEAIQKNQKALFSGKAFNRFQIMKTLASQAGIQLSRQQDNSYSRLPFSADESFSAEQLREQMNGFSLVKNVCSQCHQSNDRTPPNFLGTLTQPLTDSEQCRQIESCAPRMIYRLKMRECEASLQKNKKNPMPPETFFKDKASETQWMNLHNPKILKFLSNLVDEKELSQSLMQGGLETHLAITTAKELLQAQCPQFNAEIYEQLPKCEFKQINLLKTKTRCH